MGCHGGPPVPAYHHQYLLSKAPLPCMHADVRNSDGVITRSSGQMPFDAIETKINDICKRKEDDADHKAAAAKAEQTAAPAPTAGLFGAAPAGGGLFGAAPAGGGLFGAAPAGGGLFGAAPAGGGGLWGGAAAPAAAAPKSQASLKYDSTAYEAERLKQDVRALKRKLQTAKSYLGRWPKERQQQYIMHRMERMADDQILWDGTEAQLML